MIANQVLVLLVLVGVVGGVVGGMGGPGGIPVVLSLNLVLVLSPSIAAATASSIFVISTITATGMYSYSDGIDRRLVGVVGVPALLGTHAGAWASTFLSVRLFEHILGGVFLLAAVGIWYQQHRGDASSTAQETQGRGHRDPKTTAIIAVGSLLIGGVSGITGLGGPALTVPFMMLLGIGPVTAVGAGLGSGVLITTNTTLGHAVQGNLPALIPFAVIGFPYVVSQILGWKYVHSVSERTVSYSIAAVAALGGVLVLV